MLMSLYLILLAISIVMTVIGFAFDVSIFGLIGTIMLFLLGGVLLQENLTYKIGENEVFEYGNNFSASNWNNLSIAPSLDADAFVVSKNITDEYASFDATIGGVSIGWLLMLLGVLAFAYFIFTI